MRKSRLSRYKQFCLVDLFVVGVPARKAALLIGVNKTTASFFYLRLRQIINEKSQKFEKLSGEIEVDIQVFRENKNTEGQIEAKDEFTVLGIVERKGRILTTIMTENEQKDCVKLIRERVMPLSCIYSKQGKEYFQLDSSGFENYRVPADRSLQNNKYHIDTIENFWKRSERYMKKYKGIAKENFPLFMKECEWQYNNEDVFEKIKILKKWVEEELV